MFVYTMQSVVQPVVQPVWEPVVSCKRGLRVDWLDWSVVSRTLDVRQASVTTHCPLCVQFIAPLAVDTAEFRACVGLQRRRRGVNRNVWCRLRGRRVMTTTRPCSSLPWVVSLLTSSSWPHSLCDHTAQHAPLSSMIQQNLSLYFSTLVDYSWTQTLTFAPRCSLSEQLEKGNNQFFGRPFIKRFDLCYRTVLMQSVCPACNVGVLWTNGWMDQDKTWHGGRPRPWPHCVRWGPALPKKGGTQPPPNFRPMSDVAKWLDGSRCHTVARRDLSPGNIVLDGTHPPKGAQPPSFRSVSIMAKRSPISATAAHMFNLGSSEQCLVNRSVCVCVTLTSVTAW